MALVSWPGGRTELIGQVKQVFRHTAIVKHFLGAVLRRQRPVVTLGGALAIFARHTASGDHVAAGQILLKGAVGETVGLWIADLFPTAMADQQTGAQVHVIQKIGRQGCLAQIFWLLQQGYQVAALKLIVAPRARLPLVSHVGDQFQDAAHLEVVTDHGRQLLRDGNALALLPADQQDLDRF